MTERLPATEHTPPVALTIAGSDSGGGAGIQADLRTFAMHKVHGTSALTCITAQNTMGVRRVDPLPPDSVIEQMAAVVEDIGVNALKTGMLLNGEIIAAVATAIQTWSLGPAVVDPVMVSRAGAKLLDDSAIAIILERLLPVADILTPNRYEAEILSGLKVRTLEDMEAAARQIHTLGPKAVLVKGGGAIGSLKGTDVWYDGDRLEVLKVAAVDTRHTHGTGCTLSAAITARLALGEDPLTAVKGAKVYVTRAIQNAFAIGSGQGPVGHMYGEIPPVRLASD